MAHDESNRAADESRAEAKTGQLPAVVARVNSSFAGLTPSISSLLVLVVFTVCTGIGIVFGYYPARRAAKLNSAETLRYQ